MPITIPDTTHPPLTNQQENNDNNSIHLQQGTVSLCSQPSAHRDVRLNRMGGMLTNGG